MIPRLILVAACLWVGLALGAELPVVKTGSISDLVAQRPWQPNPNKTPGVSDPALTAQVLCAKAFTTRDTRSVTSAMKKQVFQSYGIDCLLNGSHTISPKRATRSAQACPILSYPSVGRRELMPSGTMSSSSLLSTGTASSSDVFTMGDRLKMLGVNAPGVAAEVVQFQAIRNWSDEHFIRENVRPLDSALIEDASVSPRPHDVFCPVPAPGLRVARDVVPEGGLERLRLARHAVNSNSLKRCGLWEIDHLISLELGGANDVNNLWPQFYSGEWNARIKDKLENRLHKLVCAGTIDLETAQREISTDWIASYKARMQ